LILDRALDLFNRHGIEGVGMRELARALDLSPGNLTYHFPKKEDILVALSARLSDLNSRTLHTSPPPASITHFLEMFRVIFRNHYQYRCLVLSIVHLNEHYPALAERYRATQIIRSGFFQEILLQLRAAGFLQVETTAVELQRLAAYCALIGRFWLSEYWVTDRHRPLEEIIAHYLDLLAGAFLPYVTPNGRQDLDSFLSPW
jgi:AcrR family transcriptional regulator